MAKYIEIIENENYGVRFDAVLANLGYCLASTYSVDFMKNLHKAGIDLLKILEQDFSHDKLAGMLKRSVSNSQHLNCSCVKDEYSLNACHINYVSDMISSLSNYSSSSESVLNKFLGRYLEDNNIVDFYTHYFAVLKNLPEFGNVIENPSKLLEN